MCACARQASAEDPENNGSLLEDTPESERGGERARSQEDYSRADFIKPEGGNEGMEGGRGGRDKKKRCRNVEGEMEGESEKHGGRDNGAKYLEEWGELRIVETEGGGLESQSELNVE